MPLSGLAQFEEIQLKVNDTLVDGACSDSVPILIYMRNYTATVAGFDFLLVLDRPDIMRFLTSPDTITDTLYWRCLEWDNEFCLDSMDITDSIHINTNYDFDWISTRQYIEWAAGFDTTGTLCSGWEYIRGTTPDSNGRILMISARSSIAGPPYSGGIEYPQISNIPLMKFWADANDISPEQSDRTANIFIQPDCPEFGFEDPCKFIYDENGIPIGWQFIADAIIDTICYNCEIWNASGDTCYYWSEIEESYGDSCYCCDTVFIDGIDSSNIAVNAGTLSICINNENSARDFDGNGAIDLLDIVALINYLYRNGAPPPPCHGDVNGDCVINMMDITRLISYLYPH